MIWTCPSLIDYSLIPVEQLSVTVNNMNTVGTSKQFGEATVQEQFDGITNNLK